MPRNRTEDFASKLQGLLDQVKLNMTIGQRDKLADKIMAVLTAMPDEPETQRLYDLGSAAVTELGSKITDEVLARMHTRKEELAKHAARMTAIAARAEQEANALRLKLLKSVIESTTETLASVTALKDALVIEDYEKAGNHADALLEKLLALQQKLSRQA
jgi:hypothetical protein